MLAGALAIVLWQITILATLALKIRPGFVLDSSPGLAVVHVAVASLLARWFWRQGDRAVAVSFMTFFATAHFGTAAMMILANP